MASQLSRYNSGAVQAEATGDLELPALVYECESLLNKLEECREEAGKRMHCFFHGGNKQTKRN